MSEENLRSQLKTNEVFKDRKNLQIDLKKILLYSVNFRNNTTTDFIEVIKNNFYNWKLIDSKNWMIFMSLTASSVSSSSSLSSYFSSSGSELSLSKSTDEKKKQPVSIEESLQSSVQQRVAAITLKTKIMESINQLSHSELEDLSVLFAAGFEYADPDSTKFRAVSWEKVQAIIQYVDSLSSTEKVNFSERLDREIERLLPLKEKAESAVDDDGFVLV